MKKLLFSAAIMAFGFASAQEEAPIKGFSEGDVFVSGGVGLDYKKSNESGTDIGHTVFEIIPKVGYFVSDNIAVGVSIGYTNDNAPTEFFESPIPDELFSAKSNIVTPGFFARYYFTPTNRFSLFANLGIYYSMGKFKAEKDTNQAQLSDIQIKGNQFGAVFAPGISYFISDNFALEASYGIISYISGSAKYTVNDVEKGNFKKDNFKLAFNLSNVNLGLVYKF